MKQTKALKPYHAILFQGKVVDVGEGNYALQPGQRAIEFATRKACALYPLVADWELRQSLVKLKKEVQESKSEHAYAGKEYDARKLLNFVVDGVLAAGVYVAEEYPHLAIEVQAQGITPLEAANAIVGAVARDQWDDMGTIAKESKRVAQREKIKQIEAALDE